MSNLISSQLNYFAKKLVIAFTTLVCACTLAPRYERPAAPIAAAYPTSPAYAPKPPSEGEPAIPAPASEIGWRQFFSDPRLQKLIEIALRNNRDLRLAALNVEQVRAQYRITQANLFPDLSLQGSVSRQRALLDPAANRATVVSAYQVSLAAAWEIDFFGKLRSLKEAAFAQYLSTHFARRAAEIALVSQVATQYLMTRAYDKQLELAQATLAIAQQSSQLTKARVDAGAGSALDWQAAVGAVEQARANYHHQLQLRAQADNALVLLIGEPLPVDLPSPLALSNQQVLRACPKSLRAVARQGGPHLANAAETGAYKEICEDFCYLPTQYGERAVDFGQALTDIQEGLPSDLLTHRPDILEAEENLRAANANIGAARAAFFPSIALTGQFGTASRALNGLFKPGSAAWSFTPQISLPIFSGGANVANLDLAQVQKNIAVAQYEKTIQPAFREVADGLAARDAYDKQIMALERFTSAEQRRLDLSTLRYRNGIENYLSVLTAQNDLYTAQQQLITAYIERWINLIHLYQSLGGGWLERTDDAFKVS